MCNDDQNGIASGSFETQELSSLEKFRITYKELSSVTEVIF